MFRGAKSARKRRVGIHAGIQLQTLNLTRTILHVQLRHASDVYVCKVLYPRRCFYFQKNDKVAATNNEAKKECHNGKGATRQPLMEQELSVIAAYLEGDS